MVLCCQFPSSDTEPVSTEPVSTKSSTVSRVIGNILLLTGEVILTGIQIVQHNQNKPKPPNTMLVGSDLDALKSLKFCR